MGWNSWNTFGSAIDETKILAAEFVTAGSVTAGSLDDLPAAAWRPTSMVRPPGPPGSPIWTRRHGLRLRGELPAHAARAPESPIP